MTGERLEYLAYGWLDGRLSSDERAEMEAALLAEPELREHFWRLAAFHSCLTNSPHLMGAEPRPLSVRTAAEALAFLMLGGPVRTADRWPTAATLLVTYVVFYGAFFLLLWDIWPRGVDRNQQQIAQLAADSAVGGVATLVDASDCDWEEGQAPAPIGGRITAAQPLRLRLGHAVLRFDGGAEVGIRGPVEARAISGGHLFLKRGQVAAHVPLRARGFTVETLAARLVDLGTDFAVEVSEPGETKLTVSRGVVDVTALAQADGKQGVAQRRARVTAGQSVTVSPSGHGLAVDRAAQTPEWANELKLVDDAPVAVIAYQTGNFVAGNQGSFSGGFGLDFDVIRPIQVEALGVFDDQGDGIAPDSRLDVQLWSRDHRGTPQDQRDDLGGTVLAEQNFDESSPGVLMAGHRFKSLASPLDLAVGSYTIVAYGFSDKNRNINFKFAEAPPLRAVETWRGAIAHVNSRYGGNSPGDFPLTIDSIPYVHVVGSFKFRPLDPGATRKAGAGSARAHP